MRYFASNLKFVSNILSMIVDSIFPLKLFVFDVSRTIAYFFKGLSPPRFGITDEISKVVKSVVKSMQ